MPDVAQEQWLSFCNNPLDHSNFKLLSKELQSNGDYRRLIEAYKIRAEQASRQEAILLFLTIADVWSRHLGDMVSEAFAYHNVVILGGGDNEIRSHLEELYWTLGDWNGLSSLMEMEAERADSGEQKARSFLELGVFLHHKQLDIEKSAKYLLLATSEHYSTTNDAVQTLKDLLDAHPRNLKIIEALGEIYEKGRNYHGLLDIYDKKLILLPGDAKEERSELLCQMGEMSLFHLSDPTSALNFFKHAYTATQNDSNRIEQALEALLQQDPGHHEGLRFLREIKANQRQWDEVIELAQKESNLTFDATQRSDIILYIGEILEHQLLKKEDALQYYSEAFTLNPNCANRVIKKFEETLSHNPSHALANASLRKIYTATGNWEGLLAMLESQDQKSGGQNTSNLIAMAELCLAKLKEPERSLICILKAIPKVNDEERMRIALLLFAIYKTGVAYPKIKDAFEKLANSSGRVEDLIKFLKLRMGELSSAADIAETHFELGQAYERFKKSVHFSHVDTLCITMGPPVAEPCKVRQPDSLYLSASTGGTDAQ